MSTIRPGERPALLVVDVQVAVMARAWNASVVISNIARAVESAREHGVAVIWVQHESDDLPRDSIAWQLVPELVPQDGERIIHKRFASSFEEAALEECLAEIGATHLVLAGAQTNWCIRATAYAALERGYDLTLLGDAHTTESIQLEDGTRVEAAGIVADLNLAMRWLRYPGRASGTASANDFDFSAWGGKY